jgi:hypothetical protein
MIAGREYPAGIEAVRNRAKKEFQKNANLTKEEEIMKAIYVGRWWVKEIYAINSLKKYREMKKRYSEY